MVHIVSLTKIVLNILVVCTKANHIKYLSEYSMSLKLNVEQLKATFRNWRRSTAASECRQGDLGFALNFYFLVCFIVATAFASFLVMNLLK